MRVPKACYWVSRDLHLKGEKVMKIRNTVRTRYLARALTWAIFAAICAIPAHPYLKAFVDYIQEGLNVRY